MLLYIDKYTYVSGSTYVCCFYTHERIPYPVFGILLYSLNNTSKNSFHVYTERSNSFKKWMYYGSCSKHLIDTSFNGCAGSSSETVRSRVYEFFILIDIDKLPCKEGMSVCVPYLSTTSTAHFQLSDLCKMYK